ncbi:MAG: metallophosphoesterase [Xanthobacteraceae bacterium]
MTTMRFIGDVHGRFKAYRALIKDVPRSIQVGDMGVGFRNFVGGEYTWSQNPPYDAMGQGLHRFIRGNHDNPAVCRRQDRWIADGALVSGSVFCLGGATSIDWRWRQEGLDWWADEECSAADLERHIRAYEMFRPRIVVTHEAPQSIAEAIMGRNDMRKIDDPSRTRLALQSMLEIHRPEYWVFGHWHVPFRETIDGTTFQCLAELEHTDVEI